MKRVVENTPARILETHHHGQADIIVSVFYDRELDYRKYDEMFYHTGCGRHRGDGSGTGTEPPAVPGRTFR